MGDARVQLSPSQNLPPLHHHVYRPPHQVRPLIPPKPSQIIVVHLFGEGRAAGHVFCAISFWLIVNFYMFQVKVLLLTFIPNISAHRHPTNNLTPPSTCVWLVASNQAILSQYVLLLSFILPFPLDFNFSICSYNKTHLYLGPQTSNQ